ncbi:L-threonylcarbamoyladenylate synthase [Euryarchaeota archaeon]|nr:L-threonylcarbamoyladenylate synthase [Euryarchaeota archaeon]
MELCGNKAAWQIAPDGITSVDLETVGNLIEGSGYTVEIRNRLCWTFSGPCDMTLYPSGKLMVKTEDKALAGEIAQLHIEQWAHAKGPQMTEIPSDLVTGLEAGQVIAYPTSTLPGLASLPTSQGLDALYALKQRSASQPVSLGVHSLKQASHLVEIPAVATKLLDAFPRGSLTLILDAIKPLDYRLGGARVAVRVLDHPVARALVARVGPVTATSANESGVDPLKSAEEAGAALGLPPSSILQGQCPGGQPSTLASLVKDPHQPHGYSVSIIREGVVPANEVATWMLKRV